MNLTSLPQLFVNKRFELLGKIKLNNIRINRILFPVSLVDVEPIVHTLEINITEKDYKRMLGFPEMARFRKIHFVHSKVLEYLTTLKLFDLKDRDTLFDAAGGANAEYLKVAMQYYTDRKIKCYCQDSLSGSSDKRIEYINGSIDKIPLPDKSITAISCHHSFEHFRGDLDISFLKEALRLLKIRGMLAIIPFFLANHYAEIWNTRKREIFDNKALSLYDVTATFPGWGACERFARTYNMSAFKERILSHISSEYETRLIDVKYEGRICPDMLNNVHQPTLNANMKALVIKRLK